ncbi:YaiI/YqxD family protein [Paraburkholderia sp.]|uniref:YaiI/YqxD family protein n=1 Tax=Paraburkholderia sp. TaxID=1926495 RepID=UPI0023855A95|nr:YaiI/YqxD family protein [Paraburkholderia sp.]MDE1181608.1 YaiI/YqxD family protein [Paraburkholderia sp.]
MQIWVDADACPVVVKDMLYRAARRTGIAVTLVANQFLRVPPSPLIRAIQVPAGADVADALIAERVVAGDLVITADIPLAAAVLEKHAHALDPRGNWYSPGTIEERLRMRAMLDQLRGSGVDTGGPDPFSQRDTKVFAGELDRFLARQPRPAG